MENITTEEVMEKPDMFQGRFGKVDKFIWWNTEIILTDAGTHFTSKEFQEYLYVQGSRLELSAPYHKEMNGKFEVTRQKR